MIKRLKRKFIILSLAALLTLLFAMVAGMNILNYRSVVREADFVLSLLSQNHGAFPESKDGQRDWIPSGMSPELPFETRFFSVLLGENGEAVRVQMSQIFAIDEATAVSYAKQVGKEGPDNGFIAAYRYHRMEDGGMTRITFLDCGRKQDMSRNFARFSIVMSLLGYTVISLVVCFFAGRFTRPVSESYEKQKRFITDAGHEMKTPLTIINANVDVLKMDLGENECLEDIGQQAKRLTALTNDLVQLARMEETGNRITMIDFPVSEVISETAAPFGTLAFTQHKEFACHVQPMLTMYGSQKAISQLVSIFLDNALKYSPEGGKIELLFRKQGRRLSLSVTNPSNSPMTQESLRHVFDRFYRADSSRNSQTGGYGIGLSMAQAIVLSHGGKISASLQGGDIFTITASFPAGAK